MASRTPDEIRASLQSHRDELTSTLDQLRADVNELSDWRGQVSRNLNPALAGAAAAGFLLAGGPGAVLGLFKRRV